MNPDPNRLILQSAAIPFIRTDDGFQVVLITNSKRTGWIYPKGIVEPDMTPPESASNEAWEEAGVTGNVSDFLLTTYFYEKWGGQCEVKVFPFSVTELLDDWVEKGFREREVVDLSTALEMVKPEQRKGIDRLSDYLSEFGQ